MKLIRTLEELPASVTGGAVTIGNFDGVHRGHAVLLERLVQHAGAVGGPAVVFTFDPHPVQLLHPDSGPPPLTWVERKAELLAELGADVVVACPTDRALLSLSPQDFFQKVVNDHLQAKALIEGPNFFFGRDRSGSIEDLQRLCRLFGVILEVVQPSKLGGRYISSSWIRELILAGRIEEAEKLLTQPYRVRGRVIKGAGRGRKLGFPTANIDPVGVVLPPPGVYAGRGLVGGTSYAAATHIGPNPTFGEDRVRIEVHLIHCERELYGRLLELDFLSRLRDIQPFEDAAALQCQLAEDVEAARQIAKKA
ncbi:MAG: bifunctional riboflavin kinase/FAD synthetase [Planctomycetota bacterium]